MRTLLILALSASALAQCDPARDPQACVRQVVQNEIQAQSHSVPRWTYQLQKTNAGGTKLTQIVETRQGLLGRLLAVNGHPLEAQAEASEEQRLRTLAQDPRQLHEKLARQERDRERVLKIVRALPKAFLYTYEGSSAGPYGEEWKFRFRPDPKFSPDSLEADLLKSMEGTLRISASSARLVQLQGTLTSDITLGFGLLGRVNRGGTLNLEEAPIGKNDWQVTRLVLHMNGRAVVKHIDLSVDEAAHDFRPVGPDLTVNEAIDFLLKR
jgi:hypothetical protein